MFNNKTQCPEYNQTIKLHILFYSESNWGYANYTLLAAENGKISFMLFSNFRLVQRKIRCLERDSNSHFRVP